MKKSTLKIFLVLIALITIAVCMTSSASAAQGWYQDPDDGWIWLDSNGDRATETFKQSGDKSYWLNEDGCLGSEEIVEYEDNYYYVDDTGAVVTSQWVEVENTDNVEGFGDTVWYYLKSSGKAYVSGKKTINGAAYIFDEKGRRLFGWISESNSRYSMGSKDEHSEDWKTCDYYAGEADDGEVVTSSWQLIRVYDASIGFCDYRFYFDSTSKKQKMKDDDAATGYTVKTIDGTNYAFAADGHQLTDWVDESAEEPDTKEGWSIDNGKKYYLDESGTPVYTNKIANIGNESYLFDEEGAVLAGLYYLEFDENGTITSSTYLNGDAVIDSYTTPGGANYDALKNDSKSGVYYFGEPASSSGAMVTGTQSLKIDGVSYSFKFTASGNNKGKGINGLYNNCYYVNGRKVKGNSTQKFVLYRCTLADEKVAELSGAPLTAKQVADDSSSASKNYAVVSSLGAFVESGTKKDADGYKITVEGSRVTKIYDANGNVIWTCTASTDAEIEDALTVTFILNKAECDKQVVTRGGKAVSPSTLKANVGYIYAWYTDTNCTAPYNFNTHVTADITLYGKYIECDHTGSTKTSSCTDNATCSLCGGTIAKLGHDLQWKSENGQYWQKCKRSGCEYASEKKAIPTVTITGEDKVCKANSYTATVAVSDDTLTLTASYKSGNKSSELTIEKPATSTNYTTTLTSDCYDAAAPDFKITVTAKCTDGFELSVTKTVKLEHTGTEEWVTNETTHEKKWSCCGTVIERSAEHNWNDGTCTTCSYACKHAKTDITINGCTRTTSCSVCSKTVATSESHTWNDWESNGDGTHTRKCAVSGCNAVETKECSGGATTCLKKAVCDDCHAEYGNFAEHSRATEYTSDTSGHWYACTTPGCTIKLEFAEHAPDHEGHATEAYPIKCSQCNYVIETQLTHTHEFTQKNTSALYKATDATCTKAATYYYSCTCKAAGTKTFEYGSSLGHSEGTEWLSDEDCHWHVCTAAGCGAIIEGSKAKHVDIAVKDHKCDTCGKVLSTCADNDNDHLCDVCSAKLSSHTGGEANCISGEICSICGSEYGTKNPQNHTNLKHSGRNEATTAKEGNIEYWYCDGCHRYFSDEGGTTVIALKDTVIAKLAPTPVKKDEKNATKSEEKEINIDSGASHESSINAKRDDIEESSSKEIGFEESSAEENDSEKRSSKEIESEESGIEKNDSEKSSSAESNSEESNVAEDTVEAAPETDNDSNILLWLVLLFVIGGGIAAVIVVRKKRCVE